MNSADQPVWSVRCWACCIWFSQAVATAAMADPGCAKLVLHVVKLAENVKALLPLSNDEVASPSFNGILSTGLICGLDPVLS
jgi:hypothetical protein